MSKALDFFILAFLMTTAQQTLNALIIIHFMNDSGLVNVNIDLDSLLITVEAVVKATTALLIIFTGFWVSPVVKWLWFKVFPGWKK